MSKRFYHRHASGLYEIKVRDYQYKSRPPVAVIITGTTLGERTNLYGEPCYYFHSEDAYSMAQGIALAEEIVSNLIRNYAGRQHV